jgi:prolipoprotein diacylglyceryltransferase
MIKVLCIILGTKRKETLNNEKIRYFYCLLYNIVRFIISKQSDDWQSESVNDYNESRYSLCESG